MIKLQKIAAAVPAARQQVVQLFFTSRENTASETILKVTIGPLMLWACVYGLLPWLLG